MRSEQIKVSYRDKSTSQNVLLGEIEVPRFDNVAEAIGYFDERTEGKGEESVLDYVVTAHDIEQQRIFRDANRPDREKKVSNVAKFRQLAPEQQGELLAKYGLG